MIMIFCLCLCPFLSVLSLSSHFSLFFTPPILLKLRSVPAVCHNDTISASRPPSLLPLFQLPLTLSVSVSVSFPLTRSWTEKECRSLSLFVKYSSQLSHYLSPSLPCLFNLSNHLTVAPGLPFFLLSSFTLGYNVEIRLSVPFYFSVLLHCFGLSLSVSVSFLFVTLDTVLLFVLLTFDLDESPWIMGKQQALL